MVLAGSFIGCFEPHYIPLVQWVPHDFILCCSAVCYIKWLLQSVKEFLQLEPFILERYRLFTRETTLQAVGACISLLYECVR